jgi:hypothetical protein
MPRFLKRSDANISESNPAIRYLSQIYSLPVSPYSLRSEYEVTPTLTGSDIIGSGFGSKIILKIILPPYELALQYTVNESYLSEIIQFLRNPFIKYVFSICKGTSRDKGTSKLLK